MQKYRQSQNNPQMNAIYKTEKHSRMEVKLTDIEEKLQKDKSWQQFKKNIEDYSNSKVNQLAEDENFWKIVRSAYVLDNGVLNINHGSINTMPKIVNEALLAYSNLCNQLPGYWFFEGFNQEKEKLRSRLANLVGADTEEVSIQRNTSTAMETIIFGLPLNVGDEVVLSNQDYPTLVYAWKQREKYDGIKLHWIDIPMPTENPELLIKAYTEKLNSKTKVLQIMQMFNWNGQLIPIEKISRKLEGSGIELVVDGAHLPAHLPVNVSTDGSQYWGASLHKWLSAPVGTGMMTIKKELISKVRPMMGAADPESNDIRKFETFGIYNMPLELATLTALDFLELIGLERKAARLHYLKNYCLEKLSDIPGVSTHSPMSKEFSGALGLFSLKTISPQQLQQTLFKEYNIYTVGFEYAGISGVRISPNIYHSINEMDYFIDSVLKISKTIT
ncbi:MAG: aminotransferase class V-fold PLP-dependent enzyme [Saprospirales bacterium]|nr:MAG: aminotransferase class V-fold PLP-dependent enzyme [Saprospirales bacterium]